MNMSSIDCPSTGPLHLSHPPCPQYPVVESDTSRGFPDSNGQLVQPPSDHNTPGPVKRSGFISDGGNRSRNAKAQRRHREKRKAELRLLEQGVVELEAQCGSLTRKLNRCVPEGRSPVPLMQELEAMEAENTHLRQMNEELRRQISGRRPHSAGNMPPLGVSLEKVKSTDRRLQGRDYELMRYNHDCGSTEIHVQDTPRQQRCRMSLSLNPNSSPFVASAFASADPRQYVGGRNSSGSGVHTGRPPQANWNGTGSYEYPSQPHGPSHCMITNNQVIDTGDEGQIYDRGDGYRNNGLPLFDLQNPCGSYLEWLGQQPYPLGGTPRYQSHNFPDQS